MGNNTNSVTFGGYSDSVESILAEALKWVKENPNAVVDSGILFKDESTLMVLYWREL